MSTVTSGRTRPFRELARLALALAVVALAAPVASAQHSGKLEARNRAFYGSDYHPQSYADSLGLRGLKRCENGGYYGPPQIYSRQYGTIFGYRTARPFTPPQPVGGAGYGGGDLAF